MAESGSGSCTEPIRMNRDALILLVEDNENDVLLTRLAFAKAGLANPHQVVGSAEEAMAYFRGEGRYADRAGFPVPVVALLDLSLPGISGFELIKWIRSQPELAAVHVAVLTGSAEEKDAEHARQLGANSFLSKPLEAPNTDVLIAALRGEHQWVCRMAGRLP